MSGPLSTVISSESFSSEISGSLDSQKFSSLDTEMPELGPLNTEITIPLHAVKSSSNNIFSSNFTKSLSASKTTLISDSIDIVTSNSLTPILNRHDEFLANRHMARNILGSLLIKSFEVSGVLDELKEFQRAYSHTPELILLSLFVDNLPYEEITKNNILEEYKIYGDTSLLDFKTTATCATKFLSNLLNESVHIANCIESVQNCTLAEKLSKIKETVQLPSNELSSKIKKNLAYQMFGNTSINILSGRETFANNFINNILSEAVSQVQNKEGIFEPAVKSISSFYQNDTLPCESIEGNDTNNSEYLEAVLEPNFEAILKDSNSSPPDMEINSATKHVEDNSQSLTFIDNSLSVVKKSKSLQDSAECMATPQDSSDSIILPTIRNFNLVKGQLLIENIVKRWSYDKEWMYFIQYIEYSYDKCCEYHNYEVIFSLPTPSYPIPQATASIFFTIMVNKMQDEDYPIKITYNLEGSCYVHCAEENNFNQDWLYTILCNKISFFKRITNMNTI